MKSYKDFPPTRYQGSKYKLLNWIKNSVEDLDFESVIDGFSGTSSVSYLFKTMNKKVWSNDLLNFNAITSKSFIENQKVKIEQSDLNFVLKNNNFNKDFVITDNFKDIYFNEEENIWLDKIIQNALLLDNEYKKSIILWAVFQSCITKRPYGLFHRKNLSIRNRDVSRTFGNKKTWDTPFEVHFLKFINQANNAIFENHQNCLSLNKNIFDVDSSNIDLVYLDPPYIPKTGSLTYYSDFYHFLEGICIYNQWKEKIDHNKKHKPLISEKNPLEDKFKNSDFILKLLKKFENNIVLFSYRNDGIPSIEEINDNLNKTHKKVEIFYSDKKYALSSKKTSEVLIKAIPF